MKKILILILLLCFPTIALAQGSILLAGGGDDSNEDWSDDAFTWMVEQAGGGIFINIDTDDVADYAGDFISFGADPASHGLQIPNSTVANNPATYDDLITASAIWIEGGDQWDYVNRWKGTLVEEAIRYVYNQGGVIGGTSAGMAILGEVVFDAMHGSLYPQQVAYDPYHYDATMTDDFFEFLPNVLTDTHFHDRGRLGRIIPLMARRIQDSDQPDIIGVAATTMSCIAIDQNKIGTVFGDAVTILHKSPNSYVSAVDNIPVTFTNIVCHQLLNNAQFDFNTRQVIELGDHLQPVGDPPAEYPFIDITISGSDENSFELGQFKITGMTNDEANWWQGQLYVQEGTNQVPQTVIIPRLWTDSDFFANRWVGGMVAVAMHFYCKAIYLDDDTSVTITADGMLTVDGLAYILDGYNASHVGFNNDNMPGFVNARLDFLSDGDTFNLSAHSSPLNIEDNSQDRGGLYLKGNYPNPFNPGTTIAYILPEPGHVSLDIFNAAGQNITTLVDQKQSAGEHSIIWDASDCSSGKYFYQLQWGDDMVTHSATLIK